MKQLNYILIALMMLVSCTMCLISCGGDDEDDGMSSTGRISVSASVGKYNASTNKNEVTITAKVTGCNASDVASYEISTKWGEQTAYGVSTCSGNSLTATKTLKCTNGTKLSYGATVIYSNGERHSSGYKSITVK